MQKRTPVMSVVQETYATKVAITRAATMGLKLRASTTATSTCIGSYDFRHQLIKS